MTKTVKILLDVDGPLAAFDRAVWDRRRFEGIEFDIDHLSDQTHRYLSDHGRTAADRKKVRKMVTEPGWFRRLPVVEHARAGVAALEQFGQVWACTKPLEDNPTCHSDKFAWIAEFFPSLRDRVIITPDKSMIDADVLIDDAPKPAWISRAAWKPVIFAESWNGAGSVWSGLPRISWDAEGIIARREVWDLLERGVTRDATILADAVDAWPTHPWVPGGAFTDELREVVSRNRSAL